MRQVSVSISFPACSSLGDVFEPTGALDADGSVSPSLDTITALDANCSTDDREALRPFSVLYDVRRFDIFCFRWFTLTLMASNFQPLQPDEGSTTFVSTLTVPTEVLYTFTRDARRGDISCGEIQIGTGPGTARMVDFAV